MVLRSVKSYAVFIFYPLKRIKAHLKVHFIIHYAIIHKQNTTTYYNLGYLSLDS